MLNRVLIRFNVFVFMMVAAFCMVPTLSMAVDEQKTAGVNSEQEISIESIDETICSIEGILYNITNAPADRLANELGVKADQITRKINALNELNSAYIRLKNAFIGIEKAKKEQQEIQQRDEDYRTKGMLQKPPYSLTFHDAIQAEISADIMSKKNIEVTIGILKTSLEDYQQQLLEKESELRQFKKTPTSQGALELEINELSIQSLTIMIQTVGIEIARYKIEDSNTAIRINISKERESFVGKNIYNDKEDMNHQLELIQKKENDIQSEINKFKADQNSIELEWIKAQKNLDTASIGQDQNIAQAFLKARDEWRKTYIVVLDLKRESLVLLNRQKTILQQRYAIVKKELSSDLEKQIKDGVEKNINTLNQMLKIQQDYLVNLQKQISATEGLIHEEGVSLSVKNHLMVELDALKKKFDRRLEFQSMIVATNQIERNLLSQLEMEIDQLSVSDYFTRIGQTVKKSWNLEIWVVGQQSVSVGKVFVALAILIIGMILMRYLLHLMHKRIIATSQFKETTAAAVHKALSYFGYMLVFLCALRIVNIPLTAFAFLGGAIAIGVGFGAQNLINNFISGFIILGERPINIGDLIEVDGLLGKVQEIGARCTKVRTGQNIHVLIPNSSFLEKNITNWTLSDNEIRTKVVVGVAYGSDIKKVEAALNQAAISNPRVLEHPEPFVVFSDFGENSLVFELYFWVLVYMVMEKKQLESQVRFEIDALFRKAGIVIAFPQRDIRFDEKNPLNIQLINSK